MTVEDAMKVLSENNANGLFEAAMPSTGRKLMFRPMTVGTRKTLAKFAIGEDNNEELMKFQTAKMAMLKTLCTEKIDEKELTRIDFISLLAAVRSNSSIDDLVLNMTCGVETCKKQFKHVVNFDEIIKKCSEFKFKHLEPVFYDKANRSYKLILSYPSPMDEMAMDIQAIDMEPGIYKLTYPYIFVRGLFINGEEVQDFGNLSLSKRMAVVDGLPGEILYNNSDNNLYRTVHEEFDIDSVDSVYGSLKCPNCGIDMGGVVTSDNFFTI